MTSVHWRSSAYWKMRGLVSSVTRLGDFADKFTYKSSLNLPRLLRVLWKTSLLRRKNWCDQVFGNFYNFGVLLISTCGHTGPCLALKHTELGCGGYCIVLAWWLWEPKLDCHLCFNKSQSCPLFRLVSSLLCSFYNATLFFHHTCCSFGVFLILSMDTAKRVVPPIMFVYCFGFQNLRRHMCCRAITKQMVYGAPHV